MARPSGFAARRDSPLEWSRLARTGLKDFSRLRGVTDGGLGHIGEAEVVLTGAVPRPVKRPCGWWSGRFGCAAVRTSLFESGRGPLFEEGAKG